MVDVVVVGDEEGADLTDASGPDDFEALLKGLLQPKEEEGGERRRRLQGFVFMAGVHDSSIMGELGFGRLLRFSQVRSYVGCVCMRPGVSV